MRLGKLILFLSCIAILASPAMAAEPIKATFVSCCLTKGFFWPKVEAFMRAAAEDLGIELEVVYAGMNHLRMRNMADAIARRDTPPDYLIVDNYKLMAGQMIKSADAAGVKVFLMANGLTDDQISEFGGPRERFTHWIGELTPDNERIGYQLARRLIDQALRKGVTASDGNLHLVALAGDPITPAGVQRIDGLKSALRHYPNVRLKQVVYCDWQKAVARKKTPLILKRYPEVGAIWSANDEMALGAMESVRDAGKIPGKQILFSGINWKRDALKKIEDGSMVASGGGHFMIGAWTLVLLHDFHYGKDFAKDGVTLKMNLFEILDATNVDRYIAKFGNEDWHQIDFKKFSKVLHPKNQTYDFSLSALLDQQ